MQRTIRLRLKPHAAQVEALQAITGLTTEAFNRCVAVGWAATVSNSTKLHRLTYYGLRIALPDLPSNLVVQARMKAAEALRSAFQLRKDPKRTVSQPQSSFSPPRYNQRTYRIDWKSEVVYLTLVGGRQGLPFRIPHYSAKYADPPTDTADLIERDGEWWLHVVVTVPAPDIPPSDQVVGVDLGITRPAVMSTNRFLGKKAWKAIEGRLFH